MDEKDNTLLERGADNDIVRLRWRLKVRENVVARLLAENERLRNGAAASCETVRLREDEREAIEQAIDAARGGALAEPWTAAALRLLVRRLS
jgi:hypothetical protein